MKIDEGCSTERRIRELRGEVEYDSAAIAFASIVLPQPGGPYNRTPRGALINPL